MWFESENLKATFFYVKKPLKHGGFLRKNKQMCY